MAGRGRPLGRSCGLHFAVTVIHVEDVWWAVAACGPQGLGSSSGAFCRGADRTAPKSGVAGSVRPGARRSVGPRGRRGAGTRHSVPSFRPRPRGQPLSSGGGSSPGDPSAEALDRSPRPSGVGFCCVVPGDGQSKESRPQGLPRVPVRLQPQPLGPLWVTPPRPSCLRAERLASSPRGSPFSGDGGASSQGLPSRTVRPPSL